VQQAYALALSIKCTQLKISSVSLITNDKVPEKYFSVFDEIIQIPWDDSAKYSEWKVENRWKIYHCTPYEETIVLDADMLMLEDISLWWDYCSNYDLKFCSQIKNYKLDIVHDTVHRKAFIENQLPNVYFALHYFKKSDLAFKFYKVLEFVSNNWEWCYTKFAPNEYQNWLSMDLASAISVEMLGLSDTVVDITSPLEFIHMKPAIQGWSVSVSSWQDVIHSSLRSPSDLTVGNIKQSKLFHYVEPSFLTAEIINRLESFYE
jgi:hypothetical protein